MIRIISGVTKLGGSTVVFINMTNEFNRRGIETVLYGPDNWHLDKCRGEVLNLQKLRVDANDRMITHFIGFSPRPPVKKVVLSCHEKWWFRVGSVQRYWDCVQFLNEGSRQYHRDYTGPYVIIPNMLESLARKTDAEREKLDRVAGIIGTIEDRKQTHVSIGRALADGCEKVHIFGKIGDDAQAYFEKFVQPMFSDRVVYQGVLTDKSGMYGMIGRAYHSSKGEVASLVKDECHTSNTTFLGNAETMNQVAPLTNDEIVTKWMEVLEL